MRRKIPNLRALLQRRRLAGVLAAAEKQPAAEHAAAVRRFIDQARAER